MSTRKSLQPKNVSIISNSTGHTYRCLWKTRTKDDAVVAIMISISETSSAQSASFTVSRNTSDRGPTSLSGTRSWINARVNVVVIKLAVRIKNAKQENEVP